MLAVIGWFFILAICVFFTCVGASWFILLGLFDKSGAGKWIGAIIFALGLTGVYHTANISPFTVKNNHVYEVHK